MVVLDRSMKRGIRSSGRSCFRQSMITYVGGNATFFLNGILCEDTLIDQVCLLSKWVLCKHEKPALLREFFILGMYNLI